MTKEISKKLRVYKVYGAGFDPTMDAKEHQMLRVACANAFQVEDIVLDTGASFCGWDEGAAPADADFTLPEDAKALRSKLSELRDNRVARDFKAFKVIGSHPDGRILKATVFASCAKGAFGAAALELHSKGAPLSAQLLVAALADGSITASGEHVLQLGEVLDPVRSEEFGVYPEMCPPEFERLKWQGHRRSKIRARNFAVICKAVGSKSELAKLLGVSQMYLVKCDSDSATSGIGPILASKLEELFQMPHNSMGVEGSAEQHLSTIQAIAAQLHKAA